MKHAHKSQPEPDCLQQFREENPAATWNTFREMDCYTEVRRTTRSDQGGLCAYCERQLTDHDQQIAHFHPKSDAGGSTNWALHWPNLWFACKGGEQSWMTDPDSFLEPVSENRSCDVAKGDAVVDGQVLSPADVPAFPRIFAYRQYPNRMDIVPDAQGCELTGIPHDKAEETIRIFNLNCPRLSESRMRVHRTFEAQLKRIRISGRTPAQSYPSLAARYLTKSPDGLWKMYFTMIRWLFGPIAESHLEQTGYHG